MSKNRPIDSVQKFIKEVSKISCDKDEVMFYRGHSNGKEHKLKPSVYRKAGHSENEAAMYNELCSLNSGDFLTDRTTFDRLVRMQHYGLPTRLLDITSNPLMALFFTCQIDDNNKVADGEIIPFIIDKKYVKYFDSDTVSCAANLARLSHSQRLAVGEAVDLYRTTMMRGADIDCQNDEKNPLKDVEAQEGNTIVRLLRDCESVLDRRNMIVSCELFRVLHRVCDSLTRLDAGQRHEVISMMVSCKSLLGWTKKQRLVAANIIGNYGPLRGSGSDEELDERVRIACRSRTRFVKRQVEEIVSYTVRYGKALRTNGTPRKCHVVLNELLFHYISNLDQFGPGAHKRLKDIILNHCEFLAACSEARRSVVNRAVGKVVACIRAVAEEHKKEFNETSEVAQLLHFCRDEKPHFLACIAPQDLHKVLCVQPKMTNSRITAQAGAFLLFGLDDSLKGDVEGISIGPRIVIPHSAKPKIIDELRKLNVSLATVYPQIDSTAKMIAKEHEGASKD